MTIGTGPWLSGAAHAAVALACFGVVTLQRRRPADFGGAVAPTAWLLIGLFVLALGVNRLLDLQGMATEAIRQWAKDHHWYNQRQGYQVAIMLGAVAAIDCGFLAAAFCVRRSLLLLGLPLVGAAALANRLVLLAISLHNADRVMNARLAGLSVSSMIEVFGLACVAVGTALALWAFALSRPPRRARP
jgi:hypothetical protein